MGANKPHMLASQNEEIKRMLGMVATPDVEKPSKMTDSRGFRDTGSKKSFTGLDS